MCVYIFSFGNPANKIPLKMILCKDEWETSDGDGGGGGGGGRHNECTIIHSLLRCKHSTHWKHDRAQQAGVKWRYLPSRVILLYCKERVFNTHTHTQTNTLIQNYPNGFFGAGKIENDENDVFFIASQFFSHTFSVFLFFHSIFHVFVVVLCCSDCLHIHINIK